ncbi:hypothetical protein PENDEC_c036G06183 [Penicillium decumbens]|uniref:Uncharacterized protein n=1 Tax=Penicillium decumbens TaxID=69771 RepID=A0A1V6NUP4_PENDC|nr:hypothetical protein PENDEC_c036G06183 [Penicillium decumbens]
MDPNSVPQRFTVEAKPQSTAHNTGSSSHHVPLIEQLIQSLPKSLRRPRPLSLGRIRSSGLCDVHKGLNADLMKDLLSLVQAEVTRNFRQLDEYPNLIQPIEADILAKLRALRGIWTKPSDSPVVPKALSYQINGCPACMLARIAADGETIRNLRVILQSRTRTRKKHRAPTLMVFVDECVRQFGGDEADELFGTASNLAFQMKATRKACVKAWYRDNKHLHSRHHKRRKRRRTGKVESDGSTERTSRRPHIPSIAAILEDNVDVQRQSRSVPVSDSSQEYLQYILRSLRADGSTASIHSWREVERELSMIKPCRQIANKNPHSQSTSTPVPEARVAPLRFSKLESPSRVKGSDTQVRQCYEFREDDSFLDYSSSDYAYWTDVSIDSDDDAPDKTQPRPPFQSDASRKQPAAATTTWSLVCGQGNMI